VHLEEAGNKKALFASRMSRRNKQSSYYCCMKIFVEVITHLVASLRGTRYVKWCMSAFACSFSKPVGTHPPQRREMDRKRALLEMFKINGSAGHDSHVGAAASPFLIAWTHFLEI
jgi:hypothetical protein